MKWFSHEILSTDPSERAVQCVKYLNRSGDLPERETTSTILLDTVQKYEVEQSTYAKIVNLDNYKINFWLSAFGNADAINAMLDFDGCTQALVSNMLRNKNLTEDILRRIDYKIDDSPKGKTNRAIFDKIAGTVSGRS